MMTVIVHNQNTGSQAIAEINISAGSPKRASYDFRKRRGHYLHACEYVEARRFKSGDAINEQFVDELLSRL